MSAAVSSGSEPLRRWERVGLFLGVLLLLAFGALVTKRSAYSVRRMTDYGVYARAAWAVRTGGDLWGVTDDNGWHYCYPPALAVLMAPLADPVPGADRAGYLPYPAGVVLWYALSLGCAWYAVHTLAKAVLPDAVPGTRRWWYARTIPLCVCLGGIGFTLARGQVNVLLVALVAGMFAASVAGRRLVSGAWLAGAVALKVFPAYLFLYPLLRKDTRAFAGAAVGGAVLFVALPVAVWGVGGTVQSYKTMAAVVLMPGTTGAGDQTRAKELTNTTATDSQSFQAAIHKNLYPVYGPDDYRPNDASRETRLAHWAIGGALTLVTAWVGWRRLRPGSTADRLVFLGCLCAMMMMLTPVSHMHYYALCLPLVSGLWLRGLAARPGAFRPSAGTQVMLGSWGVAIVLALLPGEPFHQMRERGFGMAATLLLWGYALATLGKTPAVGAAAEPAGEPRRLVA